MYLSQLKEEYPLIYQRVERQTSTPSALTSILADVDNTLFWGDTTEGLSFWYAVHHEKWDLAKQLEPSLFSEIEKENVKITINGLFKQLKLKKTNVQRSYTTRNPR